MDEKWSNKTNPNVQGHNYRLFVPMWQKGVLN